MGIWDGIRQEKPAKPEKPRPEDEPTETQTYDGMGAPISNPAPDDDA